VKHESAIVNYYGVRSGIVDLDYNRGLKKSFCRLKQKSLVNSTWGMVFQVMDIGLIFWAGFHWIWKNKKLTDIGLFGFSWIKGTVSFQWIWIRD